MKVAMKQWIGNDGALLAPTQYAGGVAPVAGDRVLLHSGTAYGYGVNWVPQSTTVELNSPDPNAPATLSVANSWIAMQSGWMEGPVDNGLDATFFSSKAARVDSWGQFNVLGWQDVGRMPGDHLEVDVENGNTLYWYQASFLPGSQVHLVSQGPSAVVANLATEWLTNTNELVDPKVVGQGIWDEVNNTNLTFTNSVDANQTVQVNGSSHLTISDPKDFGAFVNSYGFGGEIDIAGEFNKASYSDNGILVLNGPQGPFNLRLNLGGSCDVFATGQGVAVVAHGSSLPQGANGLLATADMNLTWPNTGA